MDVADRTDGLVDRAAELVEAALKSGATQAEAAGSRARSASVGARLGRVEATETSEADGFSLRVFVGDQVAGVSANAAMAVDDLAVRAVAMARASPPDPFATLADDEELVRDWPDLDLFDATEVDGGHLAEAALAMEEAALAVGGVTNSIGAGASAAVKGQALVTSKGFSGAYAVSRFTRSVSVVAGGGATMERDYAFDSRLFHADLDAPEALGREAGERAVRHLNPRKAKTGQGVTIVLDPRVARGFAGHLAGAVNGAAVARKTSFLCGKMDQRIMPPGIRITDNPQAVRGFGSRPFDGEGVRGAALTIVEDGVLRAWLLSMATARQLGLRTNGRGARSGSGVNPGSTNMALEPGGSAPHDLIAAVSSGFYITEVIGQGVNMVTGEYSRGAAGFRIERGEITHPVSEVTIASNLKEMFMRLTPANDIDRKYATASPTLAIEGMTLAGR